MMYTGDLVSEKFPINRGVRQGDPLSLELFTTVVEEIFRKANVSEEINADEEHHTNLRFADDVAQFHEPPPPPPPPPDQMENPFK